MLLVLQCKGKSDEYAASQDHCHLEAAPDTRSVRSGDRAFAIVKAVRSLECRTGYSRTSRLSLARSGVRNSQYSMDLQDALNDLIPILPHASAGTECCGWHRDHSHRESGQTWSAMTARNRLGAFR
jgi:hypothetical protein